MNELRDGKSYKTEDGIMVAFMHCGDDEYPEYIKVSYSGAETAVYKFNGTFMEIGVKDD